jgi:hypothetical protein
MTNEELCTLTLMIIITMSVIGYMLSTLTFGRFYFNPYDIPDYDKYDIYLAKVNKKNIAMSPDGLVVTGAEILRRARPNFNDYEFYDVISDERSETERSDSNGDERSQDLDSVYAIPITYNWSYITIFYAFMAMMVGLIVMSQA